MINMIRQSQFIALQTCVYIDKLLQMVSLPRDSSNVIGCMHCPRAVHAYFSVSDSCETLSATRIKLLLKILFVLLIAVNAGLLIPHFFVL